MTEILEAEMAGEFGDGIEPDETANENTSLGFDFGGVTAEEAPPIVEPDAQKGKEAREELRRERPRTPPKASPNTRQYRKGQFVEPLTQLYGYGAMGLMPFAPHTAQTVGMSAEQCARAWDDLAEKNLAVRRMLQTLTETSAWSGVIMAHMPIVIAVAVERGMTLPGPLGMLQAAQMEQTETARHEAAQGGSE